MLKIQNLVSAFLEQYAAKNMKEKNGFKNPNRSIYVKESYGNLLLG